MPNIKPLSDLRNYTEVLREVTVNNPVFLTKNGRGEFAIVKLEEHDKLRAAIKLMAHLEEGEKSTGEKGWLSAEEIEAILGLQDV